MSFVKRFANSASIKIGWNTAAREIITLAINIPAISAPETTGLEIFVPNSVASATGPILLDRLRLAPVDLSAVAPSGVPAMVRAAHRFVSRPTWRAAADAPAARRWDLRRTIADQIKSGANAASTMMVRVTMVHLRDVAVEAAD